MALKGNHDAMMVAALLDPAKLAYWMSKGGDAALASYGGDLVRSCSKAAPISTR